MMLLAAVEHAARTFVKALTERYCGPSGYEDSDYYAVPGPNIHGYRLDYPESPLVAREAEQEVAEPRNVDVHLTYMGCGLDMESYATGFNAGYEQAQEHQADDGDAETFDVAGLKVTRASLDKLGASLQRITDAEQSAFRNANNRLIRDALGPYAAPDAPQSPVAGQRGESNPAAGEPPELAVGLSDPSPTGGEGSPADSDILRSPAGERLTWVAWAVPAICEVLAVHVAYDYAGGVECDHRLGGADPFEDWQEWREHVAPLIAEHLDTAWRAKQSRQHIETGHDMGVSIACETFPQYRGGLL